MRNSFTPSLGLNAAHYANLSASSWLSSVRGIGHGYSMWRLLFIAVIFFILTLPTDLNEAHPVFHAVPKIPSLPLLTCEHAQES